MLPILAASTQQATQLLNFCRGIFTEIPRFAALVDNITSDTISLKNRVDIQIRSASYRTIRGITAVAAVAEELSVWQSDDSRNPDREILAAMRPALATTGGTLFCIGSPHARRGEMWNTFRKHFGPDGNPQILVANGPTQLFNPTIKQSVIDRAYEDDPQVAAAEWGGQFRNDLESYISPEIVDACTVRGIYQIDYRPGVNYIAHTDASGGRQDSFTVSIAHTEGEVGILDVLMEWRPPFPMNSPELVIIEICNALKQYGIHEVTGDPYAANFSSETFRKHGIEYRQAEMTSSQYYMCFLPVLSSGRVRLLDNKRLATQLCSLERRASPSGGKDIVLHPPNAHDGCAVVVAAVMARIVGVPQAPTLIRYEDILVDGAPLPAPSYAEALYATMAANDDGLCATVYAARTYAERSHKETVVIMDFDVSHFRVDLFPRMRERLLELSLGTRSVNLSLVCSKLLAVEATRAGIAGIIALPEHLEDVTALKPTAASLVSSGRVKLSTLAAEKGGTSPFGGALSFRPGVDIEQDPLRAASIWAIICAFEGRSQYAH